MLINGEKCNKIFLSSKIRSLVENELIIDSRAEQYFIESGKPVAIP